MYVHIVLYITKKYQKKLKNLLLKKGDSLDPTGGAAFPHLRLPHYEVASQQDLPGVSRVDS